MTVAELFPEIRPWVENLVNVWPAYIIKPQFASWEVLHILSLVILGGSSILLNLRLIGAGLTDEPPSEIARNMRPWLHVGVVGIIVTGILIGMANAERLYDSAAFPVKIIGLVAGIILTYGASLAVARTEGSVTVRARLWTIVGVALWLYALFLFLTAMGNAPGLWHVISAGALIVLFAIRGRLRWLYLAGLLALIVVHFVMTHVGVSFDDIARLDPINKTFGWIFAAWIGGMGFLQVFTSTRESGGPLTKLIGYSTILVWVTAAAAGRWIAFA